MARQAPARRFLAAAFAINPSAWVAGVASFTYSLATLGVPMMRQDWAAQPFRIGWEQILLGGFSGWSVGGAGAPRAFPTSYTLSLPFAFLTICVGNGGTLFVFMLAASALCAFGARAVARDAGCSGAAVAAAVLFAVFNPWAYTELVAGHLFMLLAYAASIWFLREALASSPRPAVLAVTALLALAQLQFFVVCTALLALLAAKRRFWWPLAIAGVAWLPMVVGILAEGHALDAIPFILSWERNQSIAPVDALQLNGYFAHYADGFRGAFATPAFATLALALPAVAHRSRRVLVVIIGTVLALVFSMGMRGPLPLVFAWSVEHVRVIALFRELFDVLGYAAIGYVMLAAITCARWRWAGWAWLATAALLPVVWVASPPARFWVPAGALPTIAVPSIANTRFALTPAFQPMSYGERGSGADPNAYSRRDNVTPLNSYLSTYPADAALGAFVLHGDVGPLEALSVSSVIERPWLRTQANALEQQWALPFTGFSPPVVARTLLLHPAPELALLPMPTVGTLDARVGGGNIFFGDAAVARGPLVPAAWRRLSPLLRVPVPRQEVHASDGWVDARLAFTQHPDLAQSLGGALTTNPGAQLAVHGALPALVFVEGTLRASDGRAIATTTNGYRWVSVPAGVTRVICAGLCVVAAQGHPPAAPLEPPAHRARGLAFRQVLPWLAVATVPPGAAGALRYNVAYDDHWSAYLGGTRLTHVRLDGVVNGWLVPSRGDARRLILIETTAAVQLLAEIFALIVMASAGVLWLRQWRRLRVRDRRDARCKR